MFKRFRSSALAAVAALALVLAAPMAANASEPPTPDEGVVATEGVPESVQVEDQEDSNDDAPVVVDDVVEEDVPSDPTTEEIPSIQAVEEDIPSDPIIEEGNDSGYTDDSSGDEVVNTLSGASPQSDDDTPWVPQSTLTLSAACAVEGESTPLIFDYNLAAGEGIYPILLNGSPLAVGGDTGGHVIPEGTHVYYYTVVKLDTGESFERGPFSFTVEVCDDEPVTLVSPLAPTIDDVQQLIYIEDDPNFTFVLESGEELQPGENVLGPIGPGVVIAVPKEGVSVDPDAATHWPFEFTDDDGPQPPVFVTPPTPTQIGNNVIIPSEEGVVYKDEDGNVVTSTVELTEDTCFTAEPDGVTFAPQAPTRWCFTYTPDTNPTDECPAFHVKNPEGECEPVDDTVITPPDDGTTDQPGDGDTRQPDDKAGLPKSGVTDRELAQTGMSTDVASLLAAASAFIVGGLLLTLRRRRSA